MLEHILEARKIQPTAMRILVLKELQDTNHALSLNELEAKFDQADKTTLYRTLKTFLQHKLVHEIEDGTGSTKYALCDRDCECKPEQKHLHFHCVKCTETFCLKESNLPTIKLPYNFKPQEMSVIIKGICDKCSSSES